MCSPGKKNIIRRTFFHHFVKCLWIVSYWFEMVKIFGMLGFPSIRNMFTLIGITLITVLNVCESLSLEALTFSMFSLSVCGNRDSYAAWDISTSSAFYWYSLLSVVSLITSWFSFTYVRVSFIFCMDCVRKVFIRYCFVMIMSNDTAPIIRSTRTCIMFIVSRGLWIFSHKLCNSLQIITVVVSFRAF